ncbi:MAG: RNA polymerase subunit sigma [Bacteroidia bacterium]|nr:MAG: RNA polymerase subunit sigma [Bacteroidia bacterium]
MLNLLEKNIQDAVEVIQNANHVTAFTGAGISVESGIPPYRGENGLWEKYDTRAIELPYFYQHPEESWTMIKTIFYDYFGEAAPNTAHILLAEMEHHKLLQSIITQNIDNLHTEAGSKTVYEFHGNSGRLLCTQCERIFFMKEEYLEELPPRCSHCAGLLKPDFIFFGENIPQEPFQASLAEAEKADVFFLIGTTGVVYPAAEIPYIAKRNGAKIVELNPKRTAFTENITDIFLPGKAGEVSQTLGEYLLPDIFGSEEEFF